MSILDFKKRFGQDIDPREVKQNFVNEINHFLTEPLDERIGHYYFKGNAIFDYICLGLNLNPKKVIIEWNKNNYNVTDYIYSLKNLTKDDFDKTLIVIELAYEYFLSSQEYDRESWLKEIDEVVGRFLNQILSLKVYWFEGKFYPEGAEELDERLIKENLRWLEKYPKVKELFANALDHYSQSLKTSVKRKDVISNSYQAVEEFSRNLLGNSKAFDNNFNEVAKQLNLVSQWGQILKFYTELSKEFGRHPGRSNDYVPTKEDTEAFLYLSGLLLRMLIEKKNNKNKDINY